MSDRPAPGRHRLLLPAPLEPPTGHLRGLDRRQVLTLGSIAVVAAAAKMSLGSSLAAAAPSAAARWPGHKPGYIYLGASSTNMASSLAETGNVGVHRTYYRWSGGAAESRNITADHAANRLPWISFKPPSMAPGGWAAVASGRYDADIRARARRFATYAKPVIVTFHHEPHNDNTGTPGEFAGAWTHIHDVMAKETNLKNIVDVPIIGEWTYNPKNKNGHPEQFITEAVLDRCAFLGADLYQTKSGETYAQRVGRIITWLDARGHSDKMVGLGETGATSGYGAPNGAQWWSSSWSWAAANTSRIGVISYYNSRHNNNAGVNWLLNETAAKLTAFKASLASKAVCHL